MEEEKKIFIECECGTHLLQVTNDVEIFDSTNSVTDKPRVRQEFWLAMFSYGTYNKKPSFWERMRIVWNFLKTGKMHEDQLILHPDEAQKLANFINENIVPTEK
jgi:hypothetical protein